MALSLIELQNHKKDIELDIQKMERTYGEAKTNHILHLLLSLISAGIWIVVWLLVANANSRKQKKLGKLIDQSKSSLIEINP